MSGKWRNVVAYYTFSDSADSKIAYDSISNSKNTNNNTYNGILESGTVNFGLTDNHIDTRTCVGFNGTGYFRIPDATINNLSSGSISVWFYFTDRNKKYTIISKQYDNVGTYAVLSVGYYINSNGGYTDGTNGIVYWHARNGVDIQSNASLNVNTWNFITISFTSGNCIIYINGVSSGSSNGNYSIPDITRPVTLTSIGYWIRGANGINNNCSMADLAIWNTNLSKDDVQFLFSVKPEPTIPLLPPVIISLPRDILIVQDKFVNSLLDTITNIPLISTGTIKYIDGPFTNTNAINIENIAGNTATNYLNKSIEIKYNTLSISFWFNVQEFPINSNNYSVIIGFGKDNISKLSFCINSAGKLYVSERDVNDQNIVYGTSIITIKTWYNVTLLVSDKSRFLYVNRFLNEIQTVPYEFSGHSINNYRIGADSTPNDTGYNGYVSNLFIYSRLL